MKQEQDLRTKILPQSELIQKVAEWKSKGLSVAFTNGCFDIIHVGHISSLQQAAQEADKLIVAVNADSSVKKLKGESRPVNTEDARAHVLAALEMVDAVVIFTEDTPRNLIVALKPDVLVKGGDYRVEDIAGATEVLSWKGRVVINPIMTGYSTTSIIGKLKK